MTLIISREIITPSFSTPSHLKTYNLSSLDQLAPDAYTPMVIFYPKSNINHSNSHVKVSDMKNSLSQTLMQYYPFAGKLDITTPSFVDCNDDGVEFLESRNVKQVTDFLQNTRHEDLDQLFPNGQVWSKLHQTCHGNDKSSPLAIQINHFACGGLTVAVSLHHKIADGTSLCNFLNDWAIVTRFINSSGQKLYVSPIEPNFISFNSTHLNYQGTSLDKSRDNSVTRSFVFPSSKLHDLKLKVIAMTVESKQPTMNLTRLEVLNWLLYKCALRAATINNLGSFKPTGFLLVANIRNKMIEPLPKTTIGNFFVTPSFPTKNQHEIRPSYFICQVKKLKMEVQGIRNIEKAVDIVLPHMSLETVTKEEQRNVDNYYTSSGLCMYPFYGIDFGWGKPIKVTFAGTMLNNSFVALDAPNGDGIEVFVSLGKQDMEIFQADPELLSFC